MDKNVNDEATPGKPGVSGRERGKKPWINLKELKAQDRFIAQNGISPEFESDEKDAEDFDGVGTGQNLHGRSDLSEQQEGRSKNNKEELYSDQKLHDSIAVSLQRNPETDFSGVVVKVHNRDVSLSGHLSAIKEKRAVEAVVRNVPGVREVFNSIETNENKNSEIS